MPYSMILAVLQTSITHMCSRYWYTMVCVTPEPETEEGAISHMNRIMKPLGLTPSYESVLWTLVSTVHISNGTTMNGRPGPLPVLFPDFRQKTGFCSSCGRLGCPDG